MTRLIKQHGVWILWSATLLANLTWQAWRANHWCITLGCQYPELFPDYTPPYWADWPMGKISLIMLALLLASIFIATIHVFRTHRSAWKRIWMPSAMVGASFLSLFVLTVYYWAFGPYANA